MAQPRTYRPAAFLHLVIRLEDFRRDTDVELTEGVPPKDAVVNIDQRLAALEKEAVDIGVSIQNEFVRAAMLADNQREKDQLIAAKKKLASGGKIDSAQDFSLADSSSIDIYTVPTDLNVDLNGITMADKMSATFPFIDAPLISEAIRAAMVEVYLGTVDETAFATKDDWRLKAERSVCVFRGYADSWDTNHTDGEATVQTEARSLECLLLDAKINPKAKAYRIAGGKKGTEKITSYVNRILGLFPPTSGKSGDKPMVAVWYGADPNEEGEISNETLNRSLQPAAKRNEAAGAKDPTGEGDETVNRDKETPNPENTAGTSPADAKVPSKSGTGSEMPVWELIVQACELAGCIPMYDPSLPQLKDATGKVIANPPDNILIRPAQTIFQDPADDYRLVGNALDKFSREIVLSDGRHIQSEIRFMVWGHNIASMKTSRKLGRTRVQAVECRGTNGDAKAGNRTVVARYPEKPIRSKEDATGGEKREEVLTRVIQGIKDKDQLRAIACHLYHQMSRHEMSVKLETSDLASYMDPVSGGNHNDFGNADLLRLRPGAPCRVMVAREVRTAEEPSKALAMSPLIEIFEMRYSELVQLLLSQRGRFSKRLSDDASEAKRVNEMVARICIAISNIKLTDLFYCRAMNHKFSADNGWSAEIELVTYSRALFDENSLSPADKALVQKLKLKPQPNAVKAPATVATDAVNAALANPEFVALQQSKGALNESALVGLVNAPPTFP